MTGSPNVEASSLMVTGEKKRHTSLEEDSLSIERCARGGPCPGDRRRWTTGTKKVSEEREQKSREVKIREEPGVTTLKKAENYA